MNRTTAGGNQIGYQLLIEWVQRKATPFVGWFNGDGLAQAIDQAIKAAREVGCKLEIRSITVLARKRYGSDA